MNKLSQTAIETKLTDFEGWELVDDALHTIFEFDNFKDAFAAMNRIAFECEKLNHHPEWTNIYNTLEIYLSTHDAEGVTEKDFELAGVIDSLIG